MAREAGRISGGYDSVGVAAGFGGFSLSGDSFTTAHVTPAASAITETQKTARPISPSAMPTPRRIAPCRAPA